MGLKEDIDVLDSKIARLKVEYEQYFLRVIKREPVQLRDEVERIILAYSNKTINNTSLKFRFNTSVAKYNSYKQYWTRVLRAIEEGTYYRKAEGGETFSPPPSNGFSQRATPAAPPKPQEKGTNPGKEDRPEIMDVYNKYIEARKSCNESTEGLTYEALRKTIEQQKKKVEEQYKTKDVDLKVTVRDGKARLIITPKKGE